MVDDFEMVKHLPEEPQLKDAIVIACSASLFGFDRRKSQQAGCNDFLPKPLLAADLL